MKTTCAKLKKENDELRKRIDELETAVEEILWRLESGRPEGLASKTKVGCSDCGADPCDCNEKIWGYCYKRSGGADASRTGGMTRVQAMAMYERTRKPDAIAGYSRGPVQRESEPPPKEWSEPRCPDCHADLCYCMPF